MAAQSGSPTFTIHDKCWTRLFCIHKKVTTGVLHLAFEYGSKDRPQHMPLQDYYKSKGIDGFMRGLNGEQKKHIRADPTGVTFDITLLCKCLRDGCHGLAAKDNDKWNERDGSSVESLISMAKNKRNELAHDQHSLTNRQLMDEAHQLKDILIKIIECFGQLYSIPNTVTDTKIAEVKTNVKKYLHDDFEPKTFEEYKKELYFEEQADYVNTEGVKDLKMQYEKLCESQVCNVNHLQNINLPLSSIYTELKLKDGSAAGQGKSITFEEVFLDSDQNKTDDIIVVSGDAGVGKTTFSKKILHDWQFGNSDMKYLIDQDIVLKIECRSKIIKNVYDLLHYLMPRVSKDFKDHDLKKVILAQNVFVIVDGIDELNPISVGLFEEILELKKVLKNLSLLITTRPEKLNYLEAKIRTHQLPIKHIQLVGVPIEKRAELVTKYHTEIAKKVPGIQGLQVLLDYLEKTKFRLADLWRLPYNLALISFLWAYDHMNVENINTAPELYREILELYKTKLMDRLRSRETTRNLPESKLKWKVDFFVKSLARESLIGLKNNHINLPQEAYNRLEEVCNYLNISAEEMTSAFLQRVPGAEVIYSFPHKGLQDYLAAFYIWMEITEKGGEIDTHKVTEDIAKSLEQNDVKLAVASDILRLAKQRLKYKSNNVGFLSRVEGYFAQLREASSVITKLMQEIHESRKYDITKFQNVFIYLIGMFYLEINTVPDKTKLEALKLLKKTLVRNNEDWIKVLNSVKCDSYAAEFISKQPNILSGRLKISDSMVSAYISLMEALKPPLKDSHSVEVDIDIKGDLDDCARKMFHLIDSHNFKVKSILMNDNNLKSYMAMLEELKIPFVNAKGIEVIVEVREDYSSIAKLLKLIGENGITISVLKAQDINMNDSNLHDIISTVKHMPRISKDGNLTGIDLNIEGNLFDVDELRDLFLTYQFKIKRFLVTENNYEKYTQMLKGFKAPIKDIEDIAMEIKIDKDIADITDLLEEIKGKGLAVTILEIRDINMNHFNYRDVMCHLKSVSHIPKEGNLTGINFDIEDVFDVDELQKLIVTYHFRIKRFMVNDKNYKIYWKMLKDLNTSPEVFADMKMAITIDKDITHISDFLNEIKGKDIVVTRLEVRDISIDNSNFHGIISVIKNLPCIAEGENLTKLSLNIKGDLLNVHEFCDLIETYHFRIISLIVNGSNYKKYTQLLKGLKMPLKDVHLIAMQIYIDRDITDIKDLLQEIKGKGIAVTDFRTRDMNINDSNFHNIISTMRHLPCIKDVGNFTGMILDLKGDSFDFYELLELIATYHFRIKVNKNNYEKYMQILRGLNRPFKNAQSIAMDIDIDSNFTDITDMLQEIIKQNIVLKVLRTKDINVNDSNIHDIIRTMKTLPCIPDNGNLTYVNLDIKSDLVGVDDLLELIATHHFRIKRFLVTKNNHEQYTQMLKVLKTPVKDTHTIEMVVNVDKDITYLSDLLKEIKVKNIAVTVLKTRDIDIDALNIYAVINKINNLPYIPKGNITGINLNIEAEFDVVELLDLIVTYHFRIRRSIVNDKNYGMHLQMLKDSNTPLEIFADMKMEITLDRDITHLSEFLNEIKVKGIIVTILNVRDIDINDYNFHDIISVIQNLPCISEDGNRTILNIKGILLDTNVFRNLIVTYHFRINLIVNKYNYQTYARLLKGSKVSFKDVHLIAMKIDVDRDIKDIRALLHEIKEKGIVVIFFRTRDVNINDSNFHDFISTMKYLPCIKVDGNLTGINLNIKGDSFDFYEFLELIGTYHFKIKVNENNYEKYTQILRGLNRPLKDTHNIAMEVNIHTDITDITELLHEIKRKEITVRVLETRDIDIVDSNIHHVIRTIKSLPCIAYDGNLTGINLDIKGNLVGVDELLELIATFHFGIKRFLVNGNNHGKYTQMLSGLKWPLKDIQSIAMEINIDTDITYITEFLQATKDKGIVVRGLTSRKININDSNIHYFIRIMKNLPSIADDGNLTEVNLDITRSPDGARELLELIASYHFRIKRFLVNGCNERYYTHMLMELKMPLKDTHNIAMEIHIHSDITCITEVLQEIKEKDIVIRVLNSRHIDINESNISNVISAMETLPHISDNGNYSEVNLNLNTMRTFTFKKRELLELIATYHFGIKKFVINENTRTYYTNMLRSLKKPLKDTHNIEMEIDINNDITKITKLLQQIKERDIVVRNLKIKDIDITDSNVLDVISIMESLPCIADDGNLVKVNLDISNSLWRADKLLELIATYHFGIKKFVINRSNHYYYAQMLERLKTPLKDSSSIALEINVDRDITDITGLLKNIKEKDISVKVLRTRDINIDSSNIHDVVRTMHNLPFIKKNGNFTEVNLDTDSVSSVYVDELLKLINTYHFKIKKPLFNKSDY